MILRKANLRATFLTMAALLIGANAQGGTLQCDGPNGEKLSLLRDGAVYHLNLEEINFHFDTLVSKLGYAIDNERYQVELTFSADNCRSNAKFPYLLGCDTSVPVKNQMLIRNLKSGAVDTRPLSQVGQVRFIRQTTEMLNSEGIFFLDDQLRMSVVAYSSEFPFVTGGISRELGFYFAGCTY